MNALPEGRYINEEKNRDFFANDLQLIITLSH